MQEIIEYWWSELLPMALNWGLSDYQFWYDDPYLLFVYEKAYELKIKDSAEQWKIKTNFKAWLEGIYIQNAVASVFSKGHSYPSKPFDLYENKDDSEKIIKKRSEQISEMLKK